MNKVIRLLGFQKKYDSVKSLFDYYVLLNLENMIKINKGTFIYMETEEQKKAWMYPNEVSPLKNQYFPHIKTNRY